jgi:hypothetical protein
LNLRSIFPGNDFNDYFTSIAHNILSSNLLPNNIEVSANAVKYVGESSKLQMDIELGETRVLF